ncbi:MAG: hypothetical protein QGF00_30215 [Planctomycetota bacterium]|jgi:hypothetical protein|nr:hypothetical protein [Planctomycetota bacterium]MDP7253915.1 hypothetical protein [Planctomycetota bacterium]
MQRKNPKTHDLIRTVSERVKDSPSYWFSVLQTGIDLSDFELAAEAQRELRRLGVEVKFRKTNLSRQQEAKNE